MLKLNHARRVYDNGQGVQDVSLGIAEGEIICLLGQSHSGKSTLLRILAQLESVDGGTVEYLNNESHVGYVSQTYTLWPHLTVLENLVLAPTVREVKKASILKKEAHELLNRFGLQGYADSSIAELSGGQRQRVALLRSVLNGSKVLLLDEITSAFDPQLTKSVLDLIRALSKEGYTMVIATHQLSFAASVADRIVFLDSGRVRQIASSIDFFSNQHDPLIKEFILELAKHDEDIEVFRGREQYQAYHLGLMRRLPEGSIIEVAGAVGDQWYAPMEDLYEKYERTRLSKKITWRMVMYDIGDTDRRLLREHPECNDFRRLPRTIENPANYNVFKDTVITQIFDEEPTIIQIRNPHIAETYRRFFEDLWELSEPLP